MNLIAIDIGNSNIRVGPDATAAKRLDEHPGKTLISISAVTGSGIKELCETLWQQVKSEKEKLN